jgi:hypothetical protein
MQRADRCHPKPRALPICRWLCAATTSQAHFHHNLQDRHCRAGGNPFALNSVAQHGFPPPRERRVGALIVLGSVRRRLPKLISTTTFKTVIPAIGRNDFPRRRESIRPHQSRSMGSRLRGKSLPHKCNDALGGSNSEIRELNNNTNSPQAPRPRPFPPQNKFIFTLKFPFALSLKRAEPAEFESENKDLLLFSTINFFNRPPLPDSTAV